MTCEGFCAVPIPLFLLLGCEGLAFPDFTEYIARPVGDPAGQFYGNLLHPSIKNVLVTCVRTCVGLVNQRLCMN